MTTIIISIIFCKCLFNGPGNFKTFLETLVSCLVSKNVNKQFVKDYLSLQEIQVRFFKFWQNMSKIDEFFQRGTERLLIIFLQINSKTHILRKFFLIFTLSTTFFLMNYIGIKGSFKNHI